MILNSSSRVLNVPSILLTEEELAHLNKTFSISLGLLRRVIKIDGEYYTWKYIDIVTELIGAYLSRVIDLECAQYDIGFYNGMPLVLSKIFFEEDFRYFGASNYAFCMKSQGNVNTGIFTYFYCFKDRLSFFDPSIRNELLKLIAVDLKMGQLDRNCDNIMFKQDLHGQTSLAPVYDFTNSYSSHVPFQYYRNPFLLLRVNEQSLKSFIRKYPDVMQYIDAMRDISMEQILSEIEQDRNVKFESHEANYRIKLDKQYSRVLKKI